jgi:hypothetical protein
MRVCVYMYPATHAHTYISIICIHTNTHIYTYIQAWKATSDAHAESVAQNILSSAEADATTSTRDLRGDFEDFGVNSQTLARSFSHPFEFENPFEQFGIATGDQDKGVESHIAQDSKR